MARPKIEVEIGADGSGFLNSMAGMERVAKKFSGAVKAYFLSAFSIGAITNLVRETIRHVQEIDKLAQKYKITTGVAQQLLTYSEMYNQDLAAIVDNMDTLKETLVKINELKIQPLFSEKELQAVREADELLKSIERTIRLGIAQQLSRSRVLLEGIFGGKMTAGEIAKTAAQYGAGIALGTTPWRYALSAGNVQWAQQAENRTEQAAAAAAAARAAAVPAGVPSGADVGQAFWFESLSPEQQAAFIAAAPRTKLAGARQPAAREERMGFRAASDALARIGGFVGGGEQRQVTNQLRAMTRHLSNIDRALTRNGIKIPDME